MIPEGLKEQIEAMPFPVLFPESLNMHDVSVRDRSEERKTVKFFISSGEKEFRVKEFFMDWFYTGFPKSIMRNLVEFYGPSSCFIDEKKIWFYGKNYKGNDSASMYISGTTVEIECYQEAKADDFRSVIADLQFRPSINDRFRDMGFSGRSFLASGNSGSWWEDQRISTFKWMDIESIREDPVHFGSLIPRTRGLKMGEDGSRERILILAEPYFERVVWIDVIDSWSEIKYGAYNFREIDGLFDTFLRERGIIYHRSPVGPTVIQKKDELLTVTVTFSPGISLEDIVSFDTKLDTIVQFVDNLFTVE